MTIPRSRGDRPARLHRRTRRRLLSAGCGLVVLTAACSGAGGAGPTGTVMQLPAVGTSSGVPPAAGSPSITGSSGGPPTAPDPPVPTGSAAPSAPTTSVGPPTATAPEPTPVATSCPETRCVSVTVTGDVLLHEPLWEQAARDGGAAGLDFGPLLAGQAPYLAASDVALCHLETPLAAPGAQPEGYPDFAVPAEIASALAGVGYDACSTASNHTADQGDAGVTTTLDVLDAAGLRHAGSARSAAEAATPTIIDTPGGAVALVAATYGLNTGGPPDPAWRVEIIDVQGILDQARRAKAAGADLVVVALHAGVEYQPEPTRDQRDTARALLASPDVDFVYGHHAHVVQPLEAIDGKWVAYGLGNSVAAHGIVDLGNREGLLVRIRFGQRADGSWRTTDVGWVPSLVDDAVPYRWCALQPGSTCSDDDATSRDRIAAVVNAEGAADAGAHLWTP